MESLPGGGGGGGDEDHRMSSDNYPSRSYALSGKIMLSAIIILFAVVIFMICLHLYARWYLRRARRSHRRTRRTHLVFYMEPNQPPSAVSAASRGLDPAVLKALPVFVYSAENHPGDAVLECAVCLSELEENEKVRLLPKCKHSFHIDCIDMWFHSHSTCPLCRTPVEPPSPKNRSDLVIEVGQIDEPGSSSGLCAACHHPDGVSLASPETLANRRKAFDRAVAAIELPPRRNESGPSSPASQGYRSPASRLMSLKRILSMNRKGTSTAVSPSSGIGASCGSAATELDIESGRSEPTQQ